MLLLAIFCFSFLFRITIIFHNPYPPSSDIGLHGSIINLILDQGTLPRLNPYHMGGEELATPPGFHFFVSILVLFTGQTIEKIIIYTQLFTAAFFSSIIVFPAYIVSKRIWKNQNAGLLAAFFASISALSIEMISWGGYTNIVSLFLIITIFYLFLRDIDKPSYKHMLMGTLVFGALIITHTFSLSVFLPILALYLVLLIAGKLGKLIEMRVLNMLHFFVISAALGIVAVSPWVMRVFNFYLSASSSGALTGGLDNRELILASRTVEPIMLTLIIVIIPTLIMHKHSRKRYLDRSSLLLISWFLVPIVMTQAYIFGIYTDYSRFMYFIDFPGIIIISASLLYLSRISTLTINRFTKIKRHRIKKVLPVIASTIIIFTFIIASLWSIFPHEGMKRADFYSTIEQPEYTALEWIKNNTPKEDSVIVADHLYGWWLSGLAERSTLSATGLEFLIYSHELDVAQNATLLLETNYCIDNGFIQARDDGHYTSRHNPEFGIEKIDGKYFGLLSFDKNQTVINYNQNRSINLTEMLVTENSIDINKESVVLSTTYESDQFTVKKTLLIKQGVRFAELYFEIESSSVDVFDVSFMLNTTADMPLENISTSTRIGAYNWYHQVAGQVILEPEPQNIDYIKNTTAEIKYNVKNSHTNIKMQVNVFDPKGIWYQHEVNNITKKFDDNVNPIEKSTELLNAWVYTDMIEDFRVSHVVCRDKDVYMKFAKDPNFQVVFNCGNVAVFQVIK